MFTIDLANHVHIGDTTDVRINGEPARLTYRDRETLVIEPDDVRRILLIRQDSKMTHFVCSDADGFSDFIVTTDQLKLWRKPDGTDPVYTTDEPGIFSIYTDARRKP
jgi:hypothetical protein